MTRKLLAAALAAAMSMACVSAQAQDSVESFYKGRQIKLNIASTPGGAFDDRSATILMPRGGLVRRQPGVNPDAVQGFTVKIRLLLPWRHGYRVYRGVEL